MVFADARHDAFRPQSSRRGHGLHYGDCDVGAGLSSDAARLHILGLGPLRCSVPYSPRASIVIVAAQHDPSLHHGAQFTRRA